MSPEPRVAVVGAGILGATLALRLAQQGINVTLLERASSPGGLAGTIDWDGHRVDRFYHVIVPSDRRMIALVDELGLSERLSFSKVGAGFFIDGKLLPFNGLGDFARFSALSPSARARLAWFVVQCQLRGGYDKLETVQLERWLRRHCGNEVTDRIWRPLLDSRFNGAHSELPATYLWARTNRMRGAREHGGGEVMGCLAGGHDLLVEALVARAAENGAEIRLGAGVERALTGPDGAVTGVMVDGLEEHFDLTIATMQPPGLRRFLPPELEPLLGAYPTRYLGVVCLLLKVRRSLSPFYAVNICDPTPITTVVETSHVVGTAHTEGLRLLYLPKYCEVTAPEFTEDDHSIYERFTAMLARIAPDFKHEDVVDWTVQRAPVVEPVHALGHQPRIAPLWPAVPGLGLVSASQVYPRLLNGESLVELGESVAAQIPARLTATEPQGVVA
jgi:protoporphyrinogen oxidase